jgi:phospholipid-binding lipoprotein MlaA
MAKWKHQIACAVGILLVSCVAISNAFADEEVRTFNPKDPYEPFNRVMWRFNDLFDKLILKPAATLYNTIVPKPIAKGINNIFSNIDTIPTVANDILQFNLYQASSDAWRLILNSTIGIGGFFDVATPLGLESNYEDLGLTLARWGWKQSNYLVIPFLGPTTVRDAAAWPVNYQYLTIYPYIPRVSTRYQIYLVGLVSKRASILRYESVIEQASLDKYVFMRNAFLQRRAYLIDRNKRLGDPYLASNAENDNDNADTETETDDSNNDNVISE